METQIFISYRRTGGEFLGKLLFDALCGEGYRVFYDVEAMNAGKFNEQIYARIDESTDFLILLTPGCLDRCASPEDWVRQEYEYAVKQGKNIIPIMTRGFIFPADLPPKMHELRLYERVEAAAGDMEFVMRKLKRLLKARSARAKRDQFAVTCTMSLTEAVYDFLSVFASMEELRFVPRSNDLAKDWSVLRASKNDTGKRRLKAFYHYLRGLHSAGVIRSVPENPEAEWNDGKVIWPEGYYEITQMTDRLLTFVRNWNMLSPERVHSDAPPVFKGLFLFQGESYRIVDVFEISFGEQHAMQLMNGKYAVALKNSADLLTQHSFFYIGAGSEPIRLEPGSSMCIEVMVYYLMFFRMRTILPFCMPADVVAELCESMSMFAGSEQDTMRRYLIQLQSVPTVKLIGTAVKPGTSAGRFKIRIDPKSESNIDNTCWPEEDFITENGKEAVLDVAWLKNDLGLAETWYYVLSVPFADADEDSIQVWRDEPHIWFVRVLRRENGKQLPELVVSPAGEENPLLLHEAILERFAMTMDICRMNELFAN